MDRLPLRILGTGLSVGGLVFVGWLAFRVFRSGVNLTDISWPPIVGSIIVQMVVLFSMPFLWMRILDYLSDGDNQFRDPASKLAIYKAFSQSWLARYVPGRI